MHSQTWVATWAVDRYQIDLDLVYSVSTERSGSRQGDRIRDDVAYRYRYGPVLVSVANTRGLAASSAGSRVPKRGLWIDAWGQAW